MTALGWIIGVIALAFTLFAALRARGLARRLESAERREAERAALQHALLTASRRGTGALLAHVGEAIVRAAPRIDAFVFFAPDGDALRCAYAEGARGSAALGTRLSRASPLLPAAAARAGCRVVLDAPRGALLPMERCAAAVPFFDAESLVGVAYCASSQAAPREIERACAVLDAAGSCYAIAHERDRDLANATYDALTGLLTPRAFREQLRDDVLCAELHDGAHVSVWFVDTDGFKAINDTLGHAAGDAVLQQMAALLRAHAVPEIDVLARNGGDEFCAIVRSVPKSRAVERAHEFCAAVRAYDFGAGRALTASIGVASYPLDAQAPNALLELADAAMYHSKRTGRDRVSYVLAPDRFAVYAPPD